VLTSSAHQGDVDAAFEAGASGYIIKPVSFQQLEQMLKLVTDYWRVSLVPERKR
jgi:DNA-binding NarL/FixJ family response regulator